MNICIWNAHSVKNKKHEVIHFLDKYNIDILLISETYLKPDIAFHIPHYLIYRADRNDQSGGGVAIMIKNSIPHTLLPNIALLSIENISIQLAFPHSYLKITSCYVPKSNHCNLRRDLNRLFNSNSPFVIGGDFNCRHSFWNCSKSNKGGRTLFDLLNSNANIVLHYPDTPTYHHNTRTNSTLDFYIASNQVPINYVGSKNELNSDHFPVLCSISLQTCHINPSSQSFNFKKADWHSFHTFIDNKLKSYAFNQNITDTTQIDLIAKELLDIIKEAARLSIPTIASSSTYKLILSDEVLNLIKLRNVRRRQWIRKRDPYLKNIVNLLNMVIKQKMYAIINVKWQDKLKALVKGSKPYWHTVRSIKKKYSCVPPLNHPDGISKIIDSNEKCEALAQNFQKVFGTSVNNLEIDDVKKSMELINNHVESDTSLFQIPTEEVKGIINSSRSFKAPGQDQIFNVFLKHLPESGFKALTNLFSHCIRFCYFPSYWKIAKVVAIVKQGSNPCDVDSYRPISLLSAISKVFECIIKNRLNDFIEENNLLIPQQFGFRYQHSTIHQVDRITQHVKTQRDLKKSTGMVLLDLEKAFDSVWIKGLLHKLHKYGFPMHIIKLLKSYFENRKYFVQIRNSKSSLFSINSGVPQGSVISPILFCVFLNDIPMKDGCEIALFADDTSIYTSDIYSQVIINRLTDYINILVAYFKKWGLKLNTNKSQAIFFSRCRMTTKLPQANLVLNGQELSWEKQVKYLGILLDPKVTYQNHLHFITSKVTKLFYVLYPLLNKKSYLSFENKILVYKVVVLAVILYGSPLWWNAANVHRQKIQILQNKFLKLILNVPRRYRTKRLHSQTKTNLIKDLSFQYYIKYKNKLPFINNRLINDLVGTRTS